MFAVGLHTCTAVARSLCISWALLFVLLGRIVLACPSDSAYSYTFIRLSSHWCAPQGKGRFFVEPPSAPTKTCNCKLKPNHHSRAAACRIQSIPPFAKLLWSLSCSVTESYVEPLKAQMSELDSAIDDQLGQIAAVKSTILHHDLRVAKLLGSVTKS